MGGMDGTTQLSRNTSALFEARLIARAVLRRHGGSWDEHPLSEWPDGIVLEAGQPTFFYNAPNGGVCSYKIRPGRPSSHEPWRTEPPLILVEGFVSAEVVAVTAYAEDGEMLGREVAAP